MTSLKKAIHKLKYAGSVIYKSAFIGYEMLRAMLSVKPKMNILFSIKKDWDHDIRRGFYGSGHKLTFGSFTEESVKNYDMVVALTIPDLKYLSQHRYLVRNNPIPIPDLEAINVCDDKYLFYQTLRKKGFGKYLPKISNDLPYPYILKKSVSGNSDDCFVIPDRETENKYRELIGGPGYFCQQMVEGTTEYATHIICKNGSIAAAINIKYVFDDSTPVKGKTQSIRRDVCRCPYLDLFAEILRAIEFEGLCCFNYKVLNGVPYILEINPRFGGSLSKFFFSFVRRLDKPIAKLSEAKTNAMI